VFSVSADRFLRGMVRAMVGTMFEVGKGKKNAKVVSDILYARDRSRAGAAAPACGLFLTDIGYPYIPASETPAFPFKL
jgi:tRNA pseudouridine38-40 synthase